MPRKEPADPDLEKQLVDELQRVAGQVTTVENMRDGLSPAQRKSVISALRARLRRVERKQPPELAIPVLKSSPPDLTENYTSKGEHEVKSGIYSTDKPCATAFSGGFKKDGFSAIRENRFTYFGEGALYIQHSLETKIQERALRLNADIVIVDFLKESPFHYKITRVDGLAKANYQGTVKARFYQSKT